jgi:hypothetical protein
MESGNIIAGTPKVFAQLVAAIQPHRSGALDA